MNMKKMQQLITEAFEREEKASADAFVANH